MCLFGVVGMLCGGTWWQAFQELLQGSSQEVNWVSAVHTVAGSGALGAGKKCGGMV